MQTHAVLFLLYDMQHYHFRATRNISHATFAIYFISHATFLIITSGKVSSQYT